MIPPAGTPVLAPQTVTSAGVNTGGIYTKGANAIYANFQVGTVTGSGAFTATLQHSNDDGVTDPYTALTVAGWGANATAAGALGGANANTDTPLASDLRGSKLWVRYAITNTAGTSAVIGATAFLGAYDTLPASGN